MKLYLSFFCLAFTLFSAPIQWTVASGGNDHWYELSSVSGNWSEARANALLQTHMGLQGYLATITSSSEQAFIVNNVLNGNAGWLGGTDMDGEGVWRWADGPEAGQVFWDQGNTLLYANWGSGEPNDYAGAEEFLLIFGDGRWNDLSPVNMQYVIEYGPASVVPEPSTVLLMIGGLGILGFSRRRCCK